MERVSSEHKYMFCHRGLHQFNVHIICHIILCKVSSCVVREEVVVKAYIRIATFIQAIDIDPLLTIVSVVLE